MLSRRDSTLCSLEWITCCSEGTCTELYRPEETASFTGVLNPSRRTMPRIYRYIFAKWQTLCTSIEGASACCTRIRGMENGYSAPFIPGYNNNTKKGIGALDLSQKFNGASVADMFRLEPMRTVIQIHAETNCS